MPRTRRTSRDAEPEIFVKVGRVGGTVNQYCLNGEHTVSDALEAAGLSVAEADRIRVNGSTADEDTVLSDGDIVTVAGRIKGGSK